MRMGQQWSDGILELFTAPWKPVYLDITVSMIFYVILFWVAIGNVKFSHIEWL